MVLSWQIYRLLLKKPFKISYGSYPYRDVLVVRLQHAGKTGFGECTEIDYYGVSLQAFVIQLKEIQSQIEKHELVHPTEFYTFLESLSLNSFLRSALDCAYWDLFGKLENKSFLDLNQINYVELPESFITVSIGNIKDQLSEMKDWGWKCIKVKINDTQVNELPELLQGAPVVALDANGSLQTHQAKWLQEQKWTKDFAFIEQPLTFGQSLYKNLSAQTSPLWMADEDCKTAEDLQKLQPHYSAINIKLMKCGGLTPALQMITRARTLGYNIMVGCMTESSIGISAGAVLAPLVDYVDLDGPTLIQNDIAQGSFIEKGEIHLSEKAGLGIELL